MRMALLETSLDRWALRWALVWVFGWSLFCVFTPIELGFDVLHYHIQDGWSALNGRLTRDLAPSGMHSYFNPLTHMVTELMIRTLPAAGVTFLLGAVQASILILIYLICRRVLTSIGHESRVSALLLALAGFFNYSMMTVTASIRIDHWIAAPFLAGLLILMPEDGRAVTWRRAGLAAFLVGIAAGMKLTAIVQAAGIAAAILIMVPGVRARIEAVIAAGLAGLAGILLTGGWWMWRLWTVVGNPVFPMGNGLFKSPYGLPENFRDLRTVPDSIWDVLFFPVNAAFRPYNEYGKTWMQDLPIGMLYIGIVLMGYVLYRAWKAAPMSLARPPSRVLVMLFGAMIATLAVWFPMFMVGRYAVAVWMIAPVLFGAILILVWPAIERGLRAFLCFGSILIICVIGANVTPLRRLPVKNMWSPYIQVDVPASIDFENAEVIFTGPYPSSFLAPYLPASATFTFNQTQPWADGGEHELKRMVRERISASDGPFIAVMVDVDAETGLGSIPVIFAGLRDTLGLIATRETCADFVTGADNEQAHWIACPLVKAD